MVTSRRWPAPSPRARGSVPGTEVTIKRVPELMPPDVAAKAGVKLDQAAPIATPAELADYDAIIFGTPTRFGNMASQMRNFLDQTGGLWAQGKLIGKVGSVFASSATQHGGQESTILSFHTTLLHQGMVIVGLPYSFAGQMKMDEITGGSPYGATTLAARRRFAPAQRQRVGGRPLPGPPCRGDRGEAARLMLSHGTALVGAASGNPKRGRDDPMGLLIDGRWHDQWYDTKSTGGAFKRQESAFRNWITADGSSGFKAEPGRYHLYVSLACPWAHRTLIFRKLKKLEDAITVSVVEPLMLENGWELAPGADPVNGKSFLYQVYTEVKPDISGRVTVPVLWDKQKRTIVSNELAEIIRMLNSEFNAFGDASLDFYPEALRAEIDEINAYVYDRINNGVYKAGFATDQGVYEQAFDRLFEALDTLEERLGAQRWLVGRPADGGRLAALHDAGALRPGLCRALQVQPAAHPGLSEPVELSARPVPDRRRGRDGEPGSHQAALLRQPQDHQPDRHRAQGAGARLRRSP